MLHKFHLTFKKAKPNYKNSIILVEVKRVVISWERENYLALFLALDTGLGVS